MLDLEYDLQSLLPSIQIEQLRDFEKWLTFYWEREIQLPQEYIDHILLFHGGVPAKACFQTPSGSTRMVCRFFNFSEQSDLTPPFTPSWRSWSETDVRLDYRVAGFLEDEFWCIRLENTTLLPIAGLDTCGHNCRDMDEMNLLCLDYSVDGEPFVVVWESSFDSVEIVAPSFKAFLMILAKCPQDVVSEEPENF
jgi:SMI1-KNR4 cell-wall